jgi:Zn-dependent metalloprotease
VHSRPYRALRRTANQKMTTNVCGVVAPHLLDALAINGDAETKRLALRTLAHTSHIHTRRKESLGSDNQNSLQGHQIEVEGIVPDETLENAAISDSGTAATQKLAQRSLETAMIPKESVKSDSGAPRLGRSNPMQRLIYDMQHAMRMDDETDESMALLPGKLVRSEGDGPVEDEAANQAYDNCAKVLEFFQQIFDYSFLDGRSVPIVNSIHFEEGYQNALWIGDSFRQMVYGDGGPKLHNFTSCLDVIGHEMTV